MVRWRGIRFSYKRYIWISLLVFAAVIAYGANVLQSPARGEILTPATPVSSQVKTATQTSGTVSDTYVSFGYPAGYTKPEGPHQSPGNLDYYVLPKHSDAMGGAAQFGITVKALDGNVGNDSGYIYRQKHPELYQRGSQMVGGHEVYVFTARNSDNGYEKTAFWPHGNKLAIITLSASFQEASFDGDFQHVINSWQWKQ